MKQENREEVLIRQRQERDVTFVMPRTMSMDVVRGLIEPTSLQPTTCGRARETGWPNITASDSIPPTPNGPWIKKT